MKEKTIQQNKVMSVLFLKPQKPFVWYEQEELDGQCKQWYLAEMRKEQQLQEFNLHPQEIKRKTLHSGGQSALWSLGRCCAEI